MEKRKNLKIAIKKTVLLFFLAVIDFAVLAFFRDFIAGDAINYGDYKYIATIITLSTFGLSFVLMIVAFFSKKGKRLATIFCVVLIVSALPIMRCANLICSLPYREFTAEKWNNNEYIYCRHFMIDDFEKNYKLVGMDIKEVKNILGEDYYYSPQDNKLYYNIGRDFLEHTKYVISYDDNGKVTSAEIHG